MYRWKWTNRKYLFTYTNMYMQHTTYSIELIEGGFNNGERGRKENETNSTVNPWYKIVIKLASRSVNKARPHPRITENLRRYRKSRISFDFLRSRKLFPSNIHRGNYYHFPRINICNGVSRESLGLKEKRTPASLFSF